MYWFMVFGLMGKKVTQAVRDNAQMNLVGVVSPVFDAKIDEKCMHL